MKIVRKIKSLLHKIDIHGLYLGRSLDTVPEGSLILFPYSSSVLSCGITGVLAFKKPATRKADIPVPELQRNVEGLAECTLDQLGGEEEALEQHYLGGEPLLRNMKGFCEDLKTEDGFCEVFTRDEYRDQLSLLCSTLEENVETEEKACFEKTGRLAPHVYEVIRHRIVWLKDILWSLQHEILENIEKIERLGRFEEFEETPHVVKQLKRVNLVFNNLDRLEVRGRDSAGISLFSVIDGAAYSDYLQRLEAAKLAEAFRARQGHPVLGNRHISLGKHDGKVSLVFTYKIAAEIGSLGDNVVYLRQQVREDDILQHLIRLPHLFQTTVAHTRWASVGEISEANCHPMDNFSVGPGDLHESRQGERTGIIHVCLNGDIDNYQGLKRDYERETGNAIDGNITTDTKIIPLRIEKYLRENKSLEEAFRLAVNDFEGSHAIAMASDLAPGKIFLAQRGSGQAMFVGLGESLYVPASEIYGFVEETSQFIKMEGGKVEEGGSDQGRGQIFVLDQESSGGLEGIRAMHYDGTTVELSEKDIRKTEIAARDIDRQNYPHYFLKEISESPGSVEQTILTRISIVERDGRPHPQVMLDKSVVPASLEDALREKKIRHVCLIGQGTAGVAAAGCAELLSFYLKGTGIRVDAYKASEFSGFMVDDTLTDTLVIAISQSGTTTDTNRAVDIARGLGAYTLAIVNRRDSDITFKVDGVFYTSTGRDIEMSVASTKAYYCQIVAGSILGLKLAQLAGSGTDDLVQSEIEHLLQLSSSMKEVLSKHEEIGRSAREFALQKKYWAVVGSGPNKISADEIRIKLSELCYKSISSDVVEDKKHIDLSSEPLIFVCAAGNREGVISDIVKDTAIFKAHQAVPIVVASEGESRFDPYADAVIHVPEVPERFAPIINTLAGHIWGYYAALAINEESRFLYDFREQVNRDVQASVDQGMDVYEIVLDETFRERIARFYTAFKERIQQGRYATAMAVNMASDLTLLLKYLSGRLPMSDFEFDFGVKGTAPNMLNAFFERLGTIINTMARPVDAIKHQAKTVTVGTSRIVEEVEGLLFEGLQSHGFNNSQLTNKNVLVLKRLQAVISEIRGTTLYQIGGLNFLGEPVEDSTIRLVKKEGSSALLASRVEMDNRLSGTKRIIIENGNVFSGKGRRDNRSILAVPVLSIGAKIDYLVLFNVGFKEQVDLEKKIRALGGKYHHIQNIVEETSLTWKDEYLNLLGIDELFGMSAEKIAESIVSQVKNDSVN
ncbi:MAG: SIS domain-containing protein [Deltaproteobacteria bacterium]|nr:SIS domain-containing protein [Deltaproteobacteria bacterium]